MMLCCVLNGIFILQTSVTFTLQKKKPRSDLRTLGPKWNIFVKPLPSGLRKGAWERLQEAEGMKDNKDTVSSRYSRTDTHMNSHVRQQAQAAQV